VSNDDVTPRGTTSTQARWDLSTLMRWVVGATLVVVLSVFTVLRYTKPYLQADGVQQSIMSIQDVDLFFWGQNRFAAFVSLLASPIADPALNLFTCLFINAVMFHAFLLVVAYMGTRAITGARQWWATVVTFLGLTAAAHLVLAPATVHVLALESQPYGMSWVLTFGAFLLWKRREWWWWVVAAAMVGAAIGLNQSVILVAAFLAVIEALRRRQWLRWSLYGIVWLAWLAVWALLSARFGGTAGPIPDAPQDYFSFTISQFMTGFDASVATVVGSFRPIRLVAVLIVAGLVVAAVPALRRSALLIRGGLGAAFVVGYWALFTGNQWVAQNQYPFRYFFPVIVFVLVCVVAPVASAVTGPLVDRCLGFAQRRGVNSSTSGRTIRGAAVGLSAVVCAVAMVGPVSLPTNADVLRGTSETGRYAIDHDVTFLAGYYWAMWPLMHHGLEAGRHAVFVTGFKSGGDPAGYTDALQRELGEDDGPPLAMCVNQDLAVCQLYLTYWTHASWEPNGQSCPLPSEIPILGSPPQRSCKILEYIGE
jgi:hypothetical protein